MQFYKNWSLGGHPCTGQFLYRNMSVNFTWPIIEKGNFKFSWQIETVWPQIGEAINNLALIHRGWKPFQFVKLHVNSITANTPVLCAHSVIGFIV